MQIEQLKRIFKFLEEKGEHIIPLSVKINLAMPIAKEELNVKGDLNLRRSNITSLPEGLKVGGDLNLNFAKITSLPEGLKVGGSLDLSNTQVELLPKGLQVGGILILKYTELDRLTKIPNGLKIGGLITSKTFITNTLDIKGDLDLTGLGTISLPEGLKVGGYLNIYNTNVTPIPKGLQVGGDLFIRASVFAMDLDDDELREMVKPGFIKGRIVR